MVKNYKPKRGNHKQQLFLIAVLKSRHDFRLIIIVNCDFDDYLYYE